MISKIKVIVFLIIYGFQFTGLHCLMPMRFSSTTMTSADDKVLLFTNKYIDQIYVPVAQYPLLSWMEVQDGKYPNSKQIKKEVQIGQPISIVVYIQDRSRLYDVEINDCLAFNGNHPDRKSVIIYPGNTDLHREKMLSWTKEKDEIGNIVLFSTFPAFKLPDRKTLNITCNIDVSILKPQNNIQKIHFVSLLLMIVRSVLLATRLNSILSANKVFDEGALKIGLTKSEE